MGFGGHVFRGLQVRRLSELSLYQFPIFVALIQAGQLAFFFLSLFLMPQERCGDQGAFNMPTSKRPKPRLYRSRKEKPCDNCRRRRTCCIRDVDQDCALCNARGVHCTFNSKPPERKRHHKPGPLQLVLSNAISLADTVPSLAEQESGVGCSRQWVGLSGAEDPYFAPPPSEAQGFSSAAQESRAKQNPDFRSYFEVRTIALRCWIR